MYLINEFKRKLGSKDKKKRKTRGQIIRNSLVPIIKVGTIAALTPLVAIKAMRLGGRIGSNLGKKTLLKRATKQLNNQVRTTAKQDKANVTSTINNLKGNQPKSTDAVLSVPDLKYLTKQQETALTATKTNLNRQNKQARRNQYGNQYNQLLQQKQLLGRQLGEKVGLTAGVLTGLGGIKLVSGTKKKKK